MIVALHTIKNHAELMPGTTYDLQMRVNHLRAWGLKGAYDFVLPSNLTVRLIGTALYGYYFTSGRLVGTGSPIAKNDYDFRFDVDYFYSEDFLFDRAVAQPQGLGYALGVESTWQPTASYSLKFAVSDGLARVYWQNAPHTQATADSRTKQYDANGYAKYSPAVSGIETTERFEQTLEPRVTIENRFLVENHYFFTESRHVSDAWYHTLGVGVRTNGNTRYALGVVLPNNAIMFEISQRRVSARLAVDAWRVKEIHQLLLEMEIRFPISQVTSISTP